MNIRCEKLKAGYGNNIIIDNLDVLFPAEAVNVIIGPSGSGKSTLLRTIAALEDPLAGHIYYENEPHQKLRAREIREKVGMIFQKPVLFEGTVYENLIFGLEQQNKDIDTEKILSTLEDFKIPSNYLKKRANKLSVGEQQRITIIRAFLPSPDVFLLDEPTSALDPQTSKRVLHLIRKLKTDFNKTVVMVSHDVREASEIADNIFFLTRGQIVFSGSYEEFKDKNIEGGEMKKFLAGEYE